MPSEEDALINMNIQIITIKSWNFQNAIKLKEQDHEHNIIVTPNITPSQIEKFNPDYIFFPHWSNKIPSEIYEKYICIVFHLTDLPFGRGGSPLQNLIIKGIYKTKITAIRATSGFDSGDIYCQEDIDISEGNAENILRQVSDIIFSKMIPYILKNKPTPIPQTGQITQFHRRTPEQSNINNVKFIGIYDFIRMLDGEGYPSAFIDTENLHITFRKVRKEGAKIKGDFEIYEK